MNLKRLKRSEIEKKYQWDLTKIYKTNKDWQKDIAKIPLLIDDLLLAKGQIMASEDYLYNTLKKEEALNQLLLNLYVYAKMTYDQDTTKEEALKRLGNIEKLLAETGEQLSFIKPEILKSDFSLITKFINQKKELKIYSFWFETLFNQKEHLLDDESEKVLAATNELLSSFGRIYDIITNTDLQYGKLKIKNKLIEITDANFISLLKEKEIPIRKKIFETYYTNLAYLKNSLASNLKYGIKSYDFLAKIRKYPSPLVMNLSLNNIDPLVYDNLIKTVNHHLPLLHKYLKLKKEDLKLKDFHIYDFYLDMDFNFEKKYSYEEAYQIIKKALKPLGNHYLSIVDKIFKENFIDVYSNIGKLSGAYSFGTFNEPLYIFLNYNGKLDQVSTLAHEIGHSVHRYYTTLKQPFIYADFAIFTAEVASIVNQLLLYRYLLNNSKDKEEKRFILIQLMELFKSTLFRQTMFAEFEKELYEKEANNEVLTEPLISDLYYKLNKKYYGKEVIHDSLIRYEWLRIPHFYRPFYVYQYATGLAAAVLISDNILSGKEKALSNYLKFLESGTSDYPLNLLKIAKVDMTTAKPIEKALKFFEKTINDYLKLNQ